MDIEIFKKQKDAAMRNAGRSVSTLEIGDFIFLDECTMKNAGFIQTLSDASQGCLQADRLCQIESITHCTEQELFENKFQFASGGSRSDVFEDDDELKKHSDNTPYQYFYSLVTLILTDTGRYAFCDAEGYDYPRYIFLGKDWREMFAEEISREEIRRNEIRIQQLKEEEESREKLKIEQEKEISETWSFLDSSKSIKANWIAACKAFFSFPVKVSKRSDYHSTPCITLICGSAEEHAMVAEMIQKAQNHFDYCTGENGIGDNGYGYVVYRNRLEDHVPRFLDNVTASLN